MSNSSISYKPLYIPHVNIRNLGTLVAPEANFTYILHRRFVGLASKQSQCIHFCVFLDVPRLVYFDVVFCEFEPIGTKGTCVDSRG